MLRHANRLAALLGLFHWEQTGKHVYLFIGLIKHNNSVSLTNRLVIGCVAKDVKV